jgi:hypothetical protein
MYHRHMSFDAYPSSPTNLPSPSSQKGLKYVTFIITPALLDAPIPPPHKPMFTNPIVEYISICHTHILE